MNEKEISEIRRRFRADRNNIPHVRGCYVNERGEIISQFYQSMALLGQTESEFLLGILKKSLSGTLGKNLIDISFSTNQVLEGEEHKLLMAMRDSRLGDVDACTAFFKKCVEAIDLEGNYLILLACDAYDVPFKGTDGEEFADGGSEVYRYILCAVCPVKLTKSGLVFHAHENAFANLKTDWVISAPEMGFLFPAFDDRSTNLYNTLYYCKDAGESHKAFTDAIFAAPIPMPAKAQKESFHTILGETLEEECSYSVVQSVQDHLCQTIAAHKEARIKEPLRIGKGEVTRVLEECGVSEERVEAFEEGYDRVFGDDAELSPRNLVDTKQTELKLPDVKIQVNPQRGDLLQTRLIDGERYILIRAGEGVEVNGVPVHIS